MAIVPVRLASRWQGATLHLEPLVYLVGTAGFEPATHGLKGQGCPITGNKREQIAVSKTACYALALFPVASQDCPFFAPECPKSVPRGS